MFNKNKKNKRGMIEVQFNWIFVMVAGFVILMFIVSIILSHQKGAETQLNMQVMQKLASSITAKQQSSNSYNEIDTMDATIQFSCDPELNYSDFKIKGGSAVLLPVQIIFSQQAISGTKLQTWTLDFNLPFHVTRFLYITNPSTAYVFYGSSSDMYVQELYDEFPTNFSRFRAKQVSEIPADFSKTIVVCYQDGCNNLESRDYIKIDTNNKPIDSVGNITFHKKSGTETKKPFVTKAALYGAIFSNNADYYQCEMNKAMKQFAIKRNFTEERIGYIVGTSMLTKLCNDTFISPRYSLRQMSGKTLQDAESLYRNAEMLAVGNDDLVYGGCPLIY